MIIRNLKYILLFTAGLIILLHTLVPHHHKGDIIAQQNRDVFEPSNSLIDIIRLAFLNDLGIGHLENYESSQSNYSFDVVIAAPEYKVQSLVEIKLQILSGIIIKNDINEDVILPNHAHFLEKIKLRGPPTLKLA